MMIPAMIPSVYRGCFGSSYLDKSHSHLLLVVTVMIMERPGSEGVHTNGLDEFQVGKLYNSVVLWFIPITIIYIMNIIGL